MAFVVIGVVVVAFAAGIAASRRRKTLLQRLAARLGGAATSSSCRGALGGVAISLEFATRGSGSSSESWTYVVAALPPGYPLALHLVEHGWFDRGKIERGEMIDVVVDDPPFDQRFLVEGAPAEVVRRMLTPRVRAYLMSHARVEVETQAAGLRLAVRRWLDDEAAATEALELTAALAVSLRDASTAVDAAAPRPVVGDAYRAMADEGPARAARAARADEVTRLEAMRAARARRGTLIAIAVVVGLVTVGALVIALAHG